MTVPARALLIEIVEAEFGSLYAARALKKALKIPETDDGVPKGTVRLFHNPDRETAACAKQALSHPSPGKPLNTRTPVPTNHNRSVPTRSRHFQNIPRDIVLVAEFQLDVCPIQPRVFQDRFGLLENSSLCLSF